MIPDDQTHVNSFSVINSKLQLQLKSIISDRIRDDEIEPFKNVKRLYHACMDTETIDSRGDEPFKKVIKSIGGWPMVDGFSWKSNGNWTWQNAMKQVATNGYAFQNIFVVGVSIDYKNNSKRILVVS